MLWVAGMGRCLRSNRCCQPACCTLSTLASSTHPTPPTHAYSFLLPPAQRLAMCNDIGEASYIDSLVAATLLETLRGLPSAPQLRQKLIERYKLDPAGGAWGACA